MGKVIAFANQKGGVGKSTLTVQAAFYLRKHRKKKVLVIDIDSQGNTTESLTQGQPYTATSSAALFEPNLEELGIFDDQSAEEFSAQRRRAVNQDIVVCVF